MLIVNQSQLPGSQFTGKDHGGVGFSFFLVTANPGDGPKLHQHEYEEVFVVQEGSVTVTIGGESAVAVAGDIAVVPPRTPHRFVNHTEGVAKLVNIHASSEIVTEWLE
ncbi:cupin domain-containing protein [Amycolatopsis sp. cg5]|uniref:cupin domain-containing protein n=1 Tax=Amycolatopsis sp. cg5 TaxID=3238802 RepID=UPI0035246080